ncbi:MAG TPA: coenzyme A pyrophosphatase [Synergistaceae bacterium]|nr:MAG: NUDIX hydrolase [Synergistales bacterium 57_84]KUK88513.1 MAG: NUDIX hydrolase [Synergistales bacterium 58_81]HBG14911.1 coenzyme A pyrophosphatase [Synergistaceae bacterium]HCP07862.1 coenzyme A pyrophosphatase [Synergistaceae bacterium]
MANDREGAAGLRYVLSKIPSSDIDRDWKDLSGTPGRKSAVLVPVFPRNGELFLLLLERSASLRRHPGQIAFPGGAMEKGDRGPVDTALREFTEETGIPGERVEIVGTLPEVRAYSSDFSLFPVVGLIPSGVVPGDLSPDSHEVKSVLEVPLKELERTPVMENFIRRGKVLSYPVFRIGDGVNIWGATAWIILNLIRTLEDGEMKGSRCP